MNVYLADWLATLNKVTGYSGLGRTKLSALLSTYIKPQDTATLFYLLATGQPCVNVGVV